MIIRLLNEGGNAVEGVSRINQENVAKTLKSFYSKVLPVLRITKNDTAVLGSTGKKLPGGSSGDIDIAVSRPALVMIGMSEARLPMVY